MSIFLTNHPIEKHKRPLQSLFPEEQSVNQKLVSLTQHSRNYVKYKREHSLPMICEKSMNYNEPVGQYDVETNLELGKVVHNFGNFTNHTIRHCHFDAKEQVKDVNLTTPYFKMTMREVSPKSPKSRHISLVKNNNSLSLPYLQSEDIIQAIDRNRFKKIPNAIILKPHLQRTILEFQRPFCARHRNSIDVMNSSGAKKRIADGQNDVENKVPKYDEQHAPIPKPELRILEEFRKGHARFNEIIQNVKKKLGRNFRDPF